MWGHRLQVPALVRAPTVSSRAPVWGASASQARFVASQEFQVVPPRGGHPSKAGISCAGRGFKSCPRVGGISTSPSFFLGASGFQVVPPCGGHLLVCSQHSRDSIVSSRAPVWGASVATDPNWEIREVSSRAPVWGASFAVHGAGRQRLFQVVPPCGGHLVCSMIATMASWFQVVPPCGGHPRRIRSDTALGCFKSCPRVGGITGI